MTRLAIKVFVPKTYWMPPKNDGIKSMTPAFIDNPRVRVNAAIFGLCATPKK